MFSELDKYKNNGHFFFQKGQNLKELSKEVPNLPGVYYILRLSRGKIDLVYIGKSGAIQQNGNFNEQGLNDRLNNKREGINLENFFNKKCVKENIDALDIYWYVSFDSKNHDLPEFVEGTILQRHFEVHGQLPYWNKEL